VRAPSKRTRITGLAVAIAVALPFWSAASGTALSAVRSGCPPRTAHLGVTAPATVNQVIAAARARIVGTVTHYQGRTERRTRQNTPVEAVIMDIGFSRFGGSRPLFHRAAQRCGVRAARYSSAVLFHDGLSVIADATITEFVVKTDRGWWAHRD
jgi:hypothetical protein